MFKSGFSKNYYVSNQGRIVSVMSVNYKRRHKHYSIRIIKSFQNRNGYNVIRITDNKLTK